MQTILVIEDDTIIRQTIQNMLEIDGYNVVVAENGKEGLKLFDKESPGLVITDIIMPEQEGIETITLLKKIDPGVKFIVMSGGGVLAPGYYLSIIQKLGVSKTLKKPFDCEELLALVREVLL